MADEQIGKRGPGKLRKIGQDPSLSPVPAQEVAPVAETVETVTATMKAQVKKVVKVRAKYLRLWHPYQQVMVHTHYPIEIPLDNWLECQIEAGLLEVL